MSLLAAGRFWQGYTAGPITGPEPDAYEKFWGNATRLLVMNRTYVWHSDPDPVWRTYNQHPGYKNGAAKAFEVNPKHGEHESPTDREFFVCLHEGQGDPGHMSKGRFHIRMTLLRDANVAESRNP